jgi:ribosomal protein S18 acetylase RimI-like enzyme
MRAFERDGLEFAALDVDAENPTAALALYQAMGYERDRSRVAWARQLG